MERPSHQALREATASLLQQGKVEELLKLSLDYIFTMLSQHSDRLDNIEHSQSSLKVHTQQHIRNLNQEIHEVASRFEPALASKCEEIHTFYEKAAEHKVAAVSVAASGRTETMSEDNKARGEIHSAFERHEASSSVEQGVSAFNATSGDGTMSLVNAIDEGQLSIVKFLLTESGPDVEFVDEYTPLTRAAMSGHLDILQYLLFETNVDYEATNVTGNTALSVAACMGHTEAVRLLWSTTGTGIESRDVGGFTPLLVATACGHLEIATYLLDEAGADADATNNLGQGVLALASACGHLGLVKFLVTELGADTGRTNNAGMTPLLEASSRGHLEVVKYFLSEHSASVDHSCSRGGTCLHHAAAQGRLKIVKYLCSKSGVNIFAPDRHGLDARCWASSALSRSMAELQSGSGGVSKTKVDRLKKTEVFLKIFTDEKVGR